MHTSPNNFLECFAMAMPPAVQFHLLKQTLNLATYHSGRDKLQDAETCVKTTRHADWSPRRSILSLVYPVVKVDFTLRERSNRCGWKHGARSFSFRHEPDGIFRRGLDYRASSRVCTAAAVPERLQRRSSAAL